LVSVTEAKIDAITTPETSTWVTGADWKPERCMVAAVPSDPRQLSLGQKSLGLKN
jgi:hypothetical protein